MSTPTQHISDQRAPTRARPDRASWTEYQRLLTAGVNPTTAAVLAAGQPRPDDERAYWRQLARRTPTTPATRAAHAAAQRQRRATSGSPPVSAPAYWSMAAGMKVTAELHASATAGNPGKYSCARPQD